MHSGPARAAGRRRQAGAVARAAQGALVRAALDAGAQQAEAAGGMGDGGGSSGQPERLGRGGTGCCSGPGRPAAAPAHLESLCS